MKWKFFTKKIKDWNIDILLIALVVLCLLLNVISLLAFKNSEQKKELVEVHSTVF